MGWLWHMGFLWWASQFFMTLGLLFVIISMQQKTSVRILCWRLAMGISTCIAWAFWGAIPALIMVAVGSLRICIGILINLRPTLKRWVKWAMLVAIFLILVVFNIIFWGGILSVLSLAIGIIGIWVFVQRRPFLIRAGSIVTSTLSIILSAILIAPVVIISDSLAIISAVVGIYRLDMKKRAKNTPKNAQNDPENT